MSQNSNVCAYVTIRPPRKNLDTTNNCFDKNPTRYATFHGKFIFNSSNFQSYWDLSKTSHTIQKHHNLYQEISTTTEVSAP